MQTPGNTIQPQTPMVPMERKLNNAYNALIRRSEENLQVERGPQARQFGRIMLQFEQLNNNMEIMRAEIRRDIRATRPPNRNAEVPCYGTGLTRKFLVKA